jgi:hypothetical protein
MNDIVRHKWGFGMSKPKPQTEVERHSAAMVVLKTLAARELPQSDTETLNAFSIVKGMFTRIVKEDQWDWFTVLGQLGYPSRSITRTISNELAQMRTAIRDGDRNGFQTAQLNLIRLPTRQCLRLFLGELVHMDEPGAGWLYILSNREMPNLLKVGMTTRTVEERVDEINRATGVPIPFGVWRCWRVSKPAEVERLSHASLAEFRLRGDREFFRVDVTEATRRLRAVIVAGNYELKTLNVAP